MSSDFVFKHIAPRWAQWILRLCSVSVRVHGQRPDPQSAWLVMANHQSYFDVIALYAVLGLPMRGLGKRELVWVPLFGWALWLGGAILIDRGNRSSSIQSVEKAAQSIRAGRSVLIFPEGTRSATGQLGPMKKGPFYLAQAAKVPILPVGVRGTRIIMPSGSIAIRSGEIVVNIGQPIAADRIEPGEQGREILAAEVANALKQLGQV